jgi:hypothetical protein
MRISLSACAPRLLLSLSVLLLGACERSVFEHPPGVAQDCDPALVGHWLSLGDRPEDRGELEAFIEPDCSLRTIEHKQDGAHRSDTTTLSRARVDKRDYLWVDATWVHRNFEAEPNLLDQPGDVYLYAYRLNRKELQLAAPAHRAVAGKVIDKTVPGDVLKQGDDLTVRVRGKPDEIRQLLRKQRLFDFDQALRFVRATPDESR